MIPLSRWFFPSLFIGQKARLFGRTRLPSLMGLLLASYQNKHNHYEHRQNRNLHRICFYYQETTTIITTNNITRSLNTVEEEEEEEEDNDDEEEERRR